MQIDKHRPPHLYFNNQIYFLTVKCYKGAPFFKNKEKFVSGILDKTIKEFNYDLYAWVILENHLHLLLKIEKEFRKFIRIFNGRIAYKINKLDGLANRRVIYQYWDRCMRNESDFWKHFNYIHNNPIKHGYIRNPDKLYLYKFSSYKTWLKRYGEKWLISCFAQYPIIDFSLPDD